MLDPTRLSIVLSIWVLCSTSGLESQLARASVTELEAEVQSALAPGDAIRLGFWREPDLNGDYTVDETGHAVLPILGAFDVRPYDPGALKTRLAESFAEELRNQEVQVTLLRKVRVLGSVAEPGLYYVDPTMSLGDAVSLAGGPSEHGRLDGIRVYRGDLLIRKDLDENQMFDSGLFSGDRIMVPKRSWISRHSTVLVGGALSATALVLSRILIR